MKVIQSKNFIKLSYSDYQTMPGFIPKNIPRGQANILFDSKSNAPLSSKDIEKIWKNKYPQGTKSKLVYQTGERIPVVNSDDDIPKISI